MKLPKKIRRRAAKASYLDGQLLVAMPLMSDKRFARSVIYMCAHSDEGAMGLIINQPARNVSAPDILQRLQIVPKGGRDALPDGIRSLPIHIGGPVEAGRGFVLHSADYFVEDSTLAIEQGVCLTATLDILKAIADGNGPNRALLALGYAGWSPGQLETEILSNGWLNCPADADLLFDANMDTKYARALGKLGIELSHLVNDAGHA